MKVLIAEPINNILHRQLSQAGFQVDYLPDTNYQTLLEIIAPYEGLVVRSRFKIDDVFFQKADNLKFVARAGSGVENINLKEAERVGVTVINSPEGNANSVAEHALGLLLGVMHKVASSSNEVRKGLWLRKPNAGDELSSKTVGIIGYGNTGSRFAKLLSGFGMQVLVYDKYKKGFSNSNIKEATRQEIFENADVISFHVPLTDETKYLCNKSYLSNFKKDIYLLNTSRGEVVYTQSVCDFLKSGKILGVGLDVLEYEKHNFDNLLQDTMPEVLQELLSMPNVIITPHVAGSSQQSVVKIASVLASKIIEKYGNF